MKRQTKEEVHENEIAIDGATYEQYIIVLPEYVVYHPCNDPPVDTFKELSKIPVNTVSLT